MAGDRPRYNPGCGPFRAWRIDLRQRPGHGWARRGDGTLDELSATAGPSVRPRGSRRRRTRRQLPRSYLQRHHPALFRGRTHGFVDFSEDVTSKDLISAVQEGYDSVELLKRYTTATMGAAQGKLETVNAVAVLARGTGREHRRDRHDDLAPPLRSDHAGRPGRRGLRTGPSFPDAAMALQHTGRTLVAGQWIRPEHYGDPEPRCVTSGKASGSSTSPRWASWTCGDRTCPNCSTCCTSTSGPSLHVGAVRYGVMCAEDGVVFDDGVTGPPGPRTTTCMTTTSSGAGAVLANDREQWLPCNHPDWHVHVTR